MTHFFRSGVFCSTPLANPKRIEDAEGEVVAYVPQAGLRARLVINQCFLNGSVGGSKPNIFEVCCLRYIPLI